MKRVSTNRWVRRARPDALLQRERSGAARVRLCDGTKMLAQGIAAFFVKPFTSGDVQRPGVRGA